MMIRVICGSSRSSCSFTFSIMKPLFPYMVLLYLTRLHVSTEFLCWLGNFPGFPTFPPTSLLPYGFPLGVIFRFFDILLLPACFLLLSTWSNLPVFWHFAPTRLFPITLHLEQSSVFLTFCSCPLASYYFTLGVIFRFFGTLLLHACFPLLSTWSNLPVF